MLDDDVASNKAIGHHGASLLQKQLADSKTLSVLTHCNTGRYFPKPLNWVLPDIFNKAWIKSNMFHFMVVRLVLFYALLCLNRMQSDHVKLTHLKLFCLLDLLIKQSSNSWIWNCSRRDPCSSRERGSRKGLLYRNTAFQSSEQIDFHSSDIIKKICLHTTVSEKDESTLECIIEFIYLWFCLSNGPWALIILIQFMFSLIYLRAQDSQLLSWYMKIFLPL